MRDTRTSGEQGEAGRVWDRVPNSAMAGSKIKKRFIRLRSRTRERVNLKSGGDIYNKFKD